MVKGVMESVTVYIVEEYGYRSWVWETGMTREDLIRWWQELETVEPYFWKMEQLPGSLIRVKDDDYEMWTLPSGETVTREEMNDSLQAHIHMDDDSYLFHGNAREEWFHKGYKATDFVTYK